MDFALNPFRRLVPFFQLAGTILSDANTMCVELRPFNDRALNRDLALLCERVNLAAPRLASWPLALFHHQCYPLILPAQMYRVT